ncbi:hypothetical protein B0I37DRAFT_364297 [Chaetomium sp. MPI-CAGE-AT-0009]|nr:hypothetical protein B0I37DRAFT_364297 [Chaetomium sp. MPI-CAGE-AT-0009]
MTPGTVPEPNPGAVVLLAGNGVKRDVAVLVPGPGPPSADVVEGVPGTETGVVSTGVVVVNSKVLVTLTLLVTVKMIVLIVTLPLTT